MPANIYFSRATNTLFLLIFLTFALLNEIAALRNEARYKGLYIENPDLCSSVTVRKELLSKKDKAGLIVRQLRLNAHSLAWEKNSVCRFKVAVASEGLPFLPKLFGVVSHESGVLAVIQDLVFRRNETTNECIDYVQFRLENGQTTQKFCGILRTTFSMDGRFQDALNFNSIGLGAVKSRKELEVVIFIAKEPLLDDENMELEIVFTLYTDCTYDTDKNMKPCGDLYRTTCIPSQFFNDSLVNCPFIDCVDEGGCSDFDLLNIFDNAQPHYGTKVLIVSGSFLCIVFGAFVCFLWVCKKHKVLCWSEDFAQPQTRVELSEYPAGGAATTTAPSAPVVPPPDEDKPPSYESLFPAR